MKKSLEELLDELLSLQEKKLLEYAAQIVPNVTSDDILQPNDYTELENHPFFRYEEGVLKGIYATKMAILAWDRESGIGS